MKLKAITVLTALFFVVTSSTGLIVHAQEATAAGYGIINSPIYNRLSGDPGSTVTGSYKITNDYTSKRTYTFKATVEDMAQSGSNGITLFDIPEFDELRDKYSNFLMRDWVTIEPEEVTLDYRESAEIRYTIDIPEDAEPGGHYAVIYWQRQALDDEAAIGQKENLGYLIFLTVNGDITESTEFVSYTSDKSWYDFPPAQLQMTLRNTGNVHTQISGKIFIHRNNLENPIETININEEDYLLLPLNERTFTESWSDSFITWQSNSDGSRYPSFDWSKILKIRFGKYDAHLRLKHVVNGEEIVTTKEISFWVFPWELITLLILVASGVTAYIVWKKKKDNKLAQ